MKVLLTGITGNVGYEVAHELVRRSISVIPCVRTEKKDILESFSEMFEEVIVSDLSSQQEIPYMGAIDGIVHSAGSVRFHDAPHANEHMMRSVLALAKKLSVPVYFVSTAYVYRPEGNRSAFVNSYEDDKFQAEEMLKISGVPYASMRPSIIVGNSSAGELRNYMSGYYLVVKAILSASKKAKAQSRMLRLPKMYGNSDMVCVDQVAQCIGDVVAGKQQGTFFMTNPEPPLAHKVLIDTLDFFNLQESVSILDMSFEEFGSLSLTEEETALYHFSKHFNPYWSMTDPFPNSLCTENLIDREYLHRTLTAFSRASL